MILIGLVGGSEEKRDQLAQELVNNAKVPLFTYAMHAPKSWERRFKILKSMLDGLQDNGRGLVLSQVTTDEEAVYIRQIGGFIWYLQGRQVNDVVLKMGDLLVTNRPGGCRHYLGPMEALSEQLLIKVRGAAGD